MVVSTTIELGAPGVSRGVFFSNRFCSSYTSLSLRVVLSLLNNNCAGWCLCLHENIVPHGEGHDEATARSVLRGLLILVASSWDVFMSTRVHAAVYCRASFATPLTRRSSLLSRVWLST